MDVFSSFGKNTRRLILVSSLFLLSLSLGLLFFGHNSISEESHLIHEVHGSAKADLLYSHPDESVVH
jgi:hypothetical protein